jgi:peptidoglycan/LPS O-acetylase OafA/YrhL
MKLPYRYEIDGLRAFAVLSVVIFHTFPNFLKGGFVGVDIFFVISGFLITSYIFKSLDKEEFSFTDFFGRRIRRIFPSLIIVMACSIAFGWFVLIADEFNQLGKHVASGAAFIANFIFASEVGYFNNSNETKPMLHLWSLAVEEQFYIIWPLVLWLGWKRKFNLLPITIIVAAISFYLNLRFVKTHPTETFFWPLGRFWELLSGSVLAWFLLYKSKALNKFKLWVDKFLVRILYSKKVKADGASTSNLMSFLGLVLLVYGVTRINENLPFPSKWTLIPILGALLVIASGSKAWFNRIFLMNPIAVWFGLISYPLYLWHWPILSFLHICKVTPQTDAYIAAVVLSILLAWLTYKFIENPIRFGKLKQKIHYLLIAFILFAVGSIGYYISNADWSESHGYENLIFQRKGFEHAFGSSLKWYKGKEGWLFLGNDYENTVAKLRLAIQPSEKEIENNLSQFDAIAKKASNSNTRVALLIGPNKSSVYKEFLPTKMNPSDMRYSTYITNPLSEIANLTVVDPTELIIKSKTEEGILYWRTNTHWNQKGSYLAFKSLMEKLNLKYPNVEFKQSEKPHSGDLISIGQLKEFPIKNDDDWNYKILLDSQINKEEFKDESNDTFVGKGKVVNKKALNNMAVWVIGDSFTRAISPYIEASFKEVRYVDHWSNKLKSLPSEIDDSNEKPNLILIVRVERSF